MISGASANVVDFGADPTGLVSSTAAILAAIDSVQAAGGGEVYFPQGTFITAPLDLRNRTNVHLQGVGHVPTLVNTTIKIISAGDVGIQFSSQENPMSSGELATCTTYSSIKDIFLDANNLVTVGLNCNTALEMENVSVYRAIEDGIVLEDFSLACSLTGVRSILNGRHGLYIRGPESTLNTFKDCTFGVNSGYGMYFEGGSGLNFTGVVSQGNLVGGMKIYFADYSSEPNNFLGRMNFDTVHFEDNGKIGVGNPGYDGDYGVFIDSYDTSASAVLCASDIKFDNCLLGKSNSGDTLNINRVQGVFIDNTYIQGTYGSSIFFGTNAYDIMQFGPKIIGSSYTDADNYLATSAFKYSPFYQRTKGAVFYGNWLSERGRPQTFTFYLSNIAQNTTALMENPITAVLTSIGESYRMYKAGTVLGVRVYTDGPAGSRAGTLTFKLVFASAGLQMRSNPSAQIGGWPGDIVVAAAETQKLTEYGLPSNVNFDAGIGLGVQVTSSADYVAATRPEIIVDVLVEY